jgi:hypothetical protein
MSDNRDYHLYKIDRDNPWGFDVCQTRTTGVADVVYVNIVTLSVGCERVGRLAKGGAVVNRPGTRVDGYSPPRAKKLVIQVSKEGVAMRKGLGLMNEITC